MLTQTRRLIVPLFVYLSLILATAVEAHDVPLHLRDHGNMKRLMKKRSPLPQDLILPLPVVGAAGIPTLSSNTTGTSTSATASVTSTTSATSTTATETSTSTTATSTGTTSTGTTSTTETSTTSTTSSTSTTSTTSSTTTSSTTSAAPPPAQTSATLDIIQQPVPSTSTVTPTFTQTTSVSAPTQTKETANAVGATGNNNDTETKSTTLTVIIAVAASVGGIAILWTVFRKWKLSSSKKFDERLRPIDWQQPTGDDGAIPTHRRASLASSFRSGSGHSDRARDPLDHDFTAGASTIGGYADLSRGPSPLPPMQENITRGPSFNRGYEAGVPLHHQGYGGTRY